MPLPALLRTFLPVGCPPLIPPLTPAQKMKLRSKAPRPDPREPCNMRLSLTIDPFMSHLRVLLQPCPEVDHQTLPQDIPASKVGASHLGPGLTLLFILSMTQVESFVIPGPRYMKWAFLHLSIQLSILRPSIYPFINQHTRPYIIHSSICPPIHSSIHPCNLQLTSSTIHPSIHVPNHLPSIPSFNHPV